MLQQYIKLNLFLILLPTPTDSNVLFILFINPAKQLGENTSLFSSF